jgi:thymidylate synthase
MNNLDKTYTVLLQDILDNGVEKKDRTGTGTLSVFGRQIRHKMSEGFPLLTTKKMHWKSIVTELLWFLRGDTNIKYLVDNGCNIWNGDAYKNYCKNINLPPTRTLPLRTKVIPTLYTQEEFINKIKTDDGFAEKWGELGPIYGKQWRRWKFTDKFTNGEQIAYINGNIDQIQNLIQDLKTNPDSRRLMVSAWNPSDLPNQILPPCHYGFQVYTRELSKDEREDLYWKRYGYDSVNMEGNDLTGIPARAISLMWNQRSVDTLLGLPFNIASYGLLLEIIAKSVNMVPDELIGNLGDVHLYSNHIEQAKEQIGRELSLEERMDWWFENNKPNRDVCDYVDLLPNNSKHIYFDEAKVPKRTREPFSLPTLKHLKFISFYKSLSEDISLITHLDNIDFQLENYQSHSKIEATLSN